MESTLKYSDETDKCYGLTGMVIGLFIYDGEQYLSSITLDGGADSSIEFTPDF